MKKTFRSDDICSGQKGDAKDIHEDWADTGVVMHLTAQRYTDMVFEKVIRRKLHLQPHHKSQHLEYARQLLDMRVILETSAVSRWDVKLSFLAQSSKWSSIWWKEHSAKCKALSLYRISLKLLEWPTIYWIEHCKHAVHIIEICQNLMWLTGRVGKNSQVKNRLALSWLQYTFASCDICQRISRIPIHLHMPQVLFSYFFLFHKFLK